MILSSSLQLITPILMFMILLTSPIQATTSPPITIVSAGSSLAALLYQKLAVLFAIDNPDLRLQYTSTGSGKGKCRLENYWLNCNTTNPTTDNLPPFVIDFAGTDSTFGPSDYTWYPDLQLYPAIAAAVVAIYNVPGLPNLVLTPTVLAAIFRQCEPGTMCPPGWIYSWSDPAILALNPDPAVQALLIEAGNITVVVRADNSGTTEIFKNALNIFDPVYFGTQVYANNGPNGAQSSVWTNVSIVKGNTNNGVVAHVLTTPGAIGYTSLDLARSTAGINYAGSGYSVLSADNVLRATAQSVGFALSEKGFDFGNNGDNVTHLTAIISGTSGSEAWPMVGYSYFAVRLNTLRANATCDNRVAVLRWLQWFYSSDAAQNAITAQGFGVLPSVLRNLLAAKARNAFSCNGVLVSASVASAQASTSVGTPVTVYAVNDVLSPFQLYGESYDESNGKTLTTVLALEQASSAPTFAVYVMDRPSALAFDSPRSMSVLPVAAAAWGIIYNLCDSTLSTSCSASLGSITLVLDTKLLLDILSGEVTMWNDPRIMNNTVNAAYLPNSPIIIIGYQQGANDLAKLQAVFYARSWVTPTFAAAQWYANNSNEASFMVGGLRNSMTVAQININQDNSISRVASMIDAAGQNVVTESASAIAACASEKDLTSTTISLKSSFSLALSSQPGCWPLAEPYFFLVPNDFTDAECYTSKPQAAVEYINHVLTLDVTPLSQQGLAPIGSNVAVKLLAQITCFDRSISALVVDQSYIPLGLVYFTWILAGAFIMVCAWLGAWIWRHRFVPLVNASSPTFMLQMTLGCALKISSIIPMTIQEDIASTQSLLNSACMAQAWLYITGFVLGYAPLLVKAYRIFRLFNNKKLHRFHITDLDLFEMEVVGTLPVFALLVYWQIYDPLVWHRTVVATDNVSGVAIVTAGTCGARNLLETLVPIIILLGCGMLSGIYLVWLTRSAPTEFSEGRYISMNIVMLAEALILGIPIVILSSANPLSSFVVKMLMVTLTVALTLIIFFVPKVAVVNGWWQLDGALPDHFSSPVKFRGIEHDASGHNNGPAGAPVLVVNTRLEKSHFHHSSSPKSDSVGDMGADGGR